MLQIGISAALTLTFQSLGRINAAAISCIHTPLTGFDCLRTQNRSGRGRPSFPHASSRPGTPRLPVSHLEKLGKGAQGAVSVGFRCARIRKGILDRSS